MKPKGAFEKLKQQDRVIRRNIIMDSAERVFATNPFHKVSMRDIAREAGIATSSIYTYFPNQETLFVEAAIRDTDILISKLREYLESSREVQVEEFINIFIDYFITHDAYFRMVSLFMLYGSISPDLVEKVNVITRSLLDVFDTLFRKKGCTGDVRMLSHVFFAALGGILISYRKYPGRSEEEIIRHMKRLGTIAKEMIEAYIRR